MRHKIVTVVCLIAVFALGVVSVQAYHNQQVQDRAHKAFTASMQAYKQRAEKAALKANYDKANADCKKGQAAYDLQTATYHKANPQRPLCDLPVVQ